MTGVHNFPHGTQVDRIPEEALGNWEESQIILEAAPLDVAHAISKFFDNAAGSLFPRDDRIQSESDSGSGDSLFITQIPTPKVKKAHVPTPKVKKAHRLQRRPRDEQHALGVVTSVLQAQSAHGARKRPKYVKKKSKSLKTKWQMRWYSFGFLPCIYNKRSTSRSKQRRIRKTRTSLRAYYNAKLHSGVIGGFFKCVKTHQLTAKHNASRDTQLSSLPRRCIDEGVTLSPLSEEDEIADDGDIKVVKRNRFATSSKPTLKKTNPPSQRAPQRPGNATNVNADITRELSRVQSSAEPTAAQEQINVDFSQCGLTTQGDDSQLKKKRKRKKEHRALDLQLTGHLEESSTIHSDDASTQKRRTSEMCTTGQIKDSGDSQKCTNGNQKATECSSVKGVEVTSKKKKNKKMSGTSTTDRVDCGGVQNEHSASVEKTGTNGTGSFLFGDTVEKDYNAHEETTVSFPAKKKKRKKCKNRAGFDMDVVENIDDSQEAVVAPNGIASTKKKKKQLLCFTGLCLEESFVKNGEEFEAHKYQSNSVSETMSLNETGLTFKKKKKYKKKEN